MSVSKRFTPKKVTIAFYITKEAAQGAAKIDLLCEHNGWEPVAMKPQKNGTYRGSITVARDIQDKYQYRFKYTMINPEILEKRGTETAQEGCLSVPEIYEEVTRASEVKVKYQDEHGEEHELEADGILAVCIQHEIDHLHGHLFIDYLSTLKRSRINKKIQKAKKEKQPKAKPEA